MYNQEVAVSKDINVRLDGTSLPLVDVNGNQIYPLLINGTTYLPLRTLADTVGVTVSWDNSNRTVELTTTKNINTKQYAEPVKPPVIIYTNPVVVKPKTTNQHYIKIQQAIQEGHTQINFQNVTKAQRDEILKLSEFLSAHEPHSGYLATYKIRTEGSNVMVILGYKDNLQEAQVKSEIQQTNEYVDNFIRNNILSTDTDVDKVYKIHQHIISNTDYLQSSNLYVYYAHVPYGIVSKGNVVCQGYAKMMQLMLDKVGIENIMTTGTGTNRAGETENHAWNIVKINNQWYNIDATWNDTIRTENLHKYDVNPADIEKILGYDSKYMLVSDDVLSKDHTWDRSKFPVAHSTFQKDTYVTDSISNILNKYDTVKTDKDLESLVYNKTSEGKFEFTFILNRQADFTKDELTKLVQEGMNHRSITSYGYSKLNINSTITIYNIKFNKN